MIKGFHIKSLRKALCLFILHCTFFSNNLNAQEIAAKPKSIGIDFYNLAFVALLLLIIFTVFNSLKKVVSSLNLELKTKEGKEAEILKTTISEIHEQNQVLIYLTSIFIFLYISYVSVKGTMYESHIVEWMNLIVRWVHVVFGIAWIGASFYFNFLENSLNRTENLREELAGNLWAVHGGGFYYLEKYKVAPKTLPKELHWFKYEAYFTWLSGFTLLVIVYYLDAKVYLIDKEVFDTTPALAVLIGVVSLALGWIVYDLLCKSPLSKKPILFWVILFLFIAGFAWFFLQVFSSRAAYIHVGALIGTMMVGNVFRVIIPSQKAMVNAAKIGELPNPQFGKNALLRSRHNNYLTLPVIYIMISNHFPSTYGSNFNWFVLLGLSLCSVLVKHYLNKMEQGQKAVWLLPIAALGIFALTFITAPKKKEVCIEDKPATFVEVNAIMEKRCVQCHSANPTDDLIKVAPNGVMFDTPEKIKNLTDKIMSRAILTKSMPQGNKTNMTQEERDLIQCWIENGASLK